MVRSFAENTSLRQQNTPWKSAVVIRDTRRHPNEKTMNHAVAFTGTCNMSSKHPPRKDHAKAQTLARGWEHFWSSLCDELCSPESVLSAHEIFPRLHSRGPLSCEAIRLNKIGNTQWVKRCTKLVRQLNLR